ncbi:hypothetical protein B484DRAFT_479103 [Ochromonadaceae sp. CCMP2298]|nr:hypothetical protein B484DRAFT_479103 [Ochromonadaceae sp. CCMP2298]
MSSFHSRMLQIAVALAVLCAVESLATGNVGISPLLRYGRTLSPVVTPHGSARATRLSLNPEDILEDDVELLVLLRKQMENSLSASPREITNRIKDFFSPRRNTRDDQAMFKTYLASNKGAMDAVNVILLVEGCHRNNVNLLDLTNWPALIDAMQRPSGLFTSSMIYRGISCLKFLDMRSPHAAQFLRLLWERIEESGVLLGEQDICPAIYSLQSLSGQGTHMRSIVRYFARSMGATREPIAAKPMCSAIYGLRRQKPTPEVRALMWEIANRVEATDTYYHSVNVCIALNGLQSSDDCYPEVRRLLDVLLDKAIDANEQGFDAAKDREISMALFGLQKMGYRGKTVKPMGGQGRRSEDEDDYSDSFRDAHRDDRTGDRGSGYDAYKSGQRGRDGARGEGWGKPSATVPWADPHLTSVVDAYIAAGGSSAGVEKDRTNLIKYTAVQAWTRPGAKESWRNQNFKNDKSSASTSASASSASASRSASSTGKSTYTPELQRVLRYLVTLLQHFQAPFEAKRLGFAMLGLSRLDAELPEVGALLGELTAKAQSAWGEVNGQELSMILHGLVGLQSDHPQVRTLVSHLVPLVTRCPQMSTSDARSALYGLQGMHSGNSKEAEALFSALGDLLARSNIRFDSPADISNTLYGLQGLSSDSPATKKVLMGVLQMVQGVDTSRPFTGRDVAMSLYGLRGANGRSRETLDLLGVLAPHVANLRGQLSANDVATFLYGLQNFQSSQPEVSALLRAIAPHVSRARGTFNSKGLSMALNGLQGFDSAQEEVRELLRGIVAITQRTDFRGFEDFHQLSSALYGLSDLSSEHVEVVALVDVVAGMMGGGGVDRGKAWTRKPAVDGAVGTGAVGAGAGEVISLTRRLASLQNTETPKADKVAMALYGLQKMDPALPSVAALLEVLVEYVAAMPSPSGIATGMALRAFRQHSGAPTPAQARILFLLAEKIPGWSGRKLSRTSGSISRVRKPGPSDSLATVRSSLGGIAGLDRGAESVRAVLGALASELLGEEFDLQRLDASTFGIIAAAYGVEGLEGLQGAGGRGWDSSPILPESAYFTQHHGSSQEAVVRLRQTLRGVKAKQAREPRAPRAPRGARAPRDAREPRAPRAARAVGSVEGGNTPGDARERAPRVRAVAGAVVR